MVDDKAKLAHLIHQVNNLLGVIRIQAAVAREVGTESALQQALRTIESAAGKTEDVARQVTRAGDQQ